MKKISIYNEITREKEPFTPLEPGRVKMYVCGPTVYDFFHVGNARCFVVFDFFRRFLEFLGYKVDYVQNFTDIDDKMIKRAAAENLSVGEIAEKYIAEYKTDAEGLAITPASRHPRATENIDAVISVISALVEKNHAYAAEKDESGNSDVYFSAKSFKGYGEISGTDTDDLESGIRVGIGENKRDPLDFVLWKSYKPGEPFWDSPWGKGRPGWHIECSAMIKTLLGDTIDFHCGGKDLAFPHHENENAQSVCANSAPFVKYWLHNGFITTDNAKMSKSEGNFFTVREISEKYGYMPIRFFLLASTYRTPVNFSEEIIEAAKNSLDRIYTCGENLRFALKTADKSADTGEINGALAAYFDRAVDALCDDFNTADAMSRFFEFIREVNTKILGRGGAPSEASVKSALAEYEKFMSLFGFMPREVKKAAVEASFVEERIAARAEAKKNKDYAKADQIRAELSELGIVIEDTPAGVKWKYA